MNSIKFLKNIIKKTGIYRKLYRGILIVKNYSRRMDISLTQAFIRCRIKSSNFAEIMESAMIHNVGHGDFFYSIDESIQIMSDNRIIGNMPLDYGAILNGNIGNEHVLNVVKNYIARTGDSRLSLSKPGTLKSALQYILLWNSILWQTGHRLVGLGRLDKVLDSYELTDDAEELVCDFFKTLHENYKYKSNALKGDTGQIIILGGLEEDGTYFANDYTYLLLKCAGIVGLPDPKLLVRVAENMPKDLLTLCVEVISTGIGSPLLSNDDVVIKLLTDFGYDLKDAFNYGTSACWEPLSIGNSLEQNNLADIGFGKCMCETILDRNFIRCKSIDDVFDIFFLKLGEEIKNKLQVLDLIRWEHDELISALMGLNKDISEGGAKYNNYGILSVGMSAAVNSLINIFNYAFIERKYSLKELQEIVVSNYKSGINDFCDNNEGFGTESENAIEYTNRIIHETEKLVKNYRNMFGGKVKFGLSSPNYLTSATSVGATLDGRKAGAPFQTHISKENNKSITEIINFESKLEFSEVSSNANVLDIMIQASLIKDNIDKFARYIEGGIRKGFFQMQINVLSYQQLVEARKDPDKFPNLIVRVWGFSAYFNDLPDEYKDNLIRRAKEMECGV